MRLGILLALAASQLAFAKDTILVNRIGPSGGELFIANADGSGERNLNTGGKMDYDAMFSTDGKWIVFTSERNASSNIYRIHPDGSGVERLTDNAGFDDQATLSPDGNQLAFISSRGGGSNNIWILDIKTRKVRNLRGGLEAPAGKLNGFFRPSWSPDGKWIAFSSDRGTDFKGHKFPGPGWEHIQAASIYVIQPDGAGLRKLTPEGEMAGSPKWSADGKQLVFYAMDAEYTFAARGFGAVESQIVSVDLATGARKTYTSGTGLKVSPQFLSADRIGYLKKGPGQKGELAFTTGEHGVDGPAPGVVRNPAWSPDGKQVVYQKFAYASKQNQPLFAKDGRFDIRFSGEFPAISSTGKLVLSPFGEVGASATKPFDKLAVYVSDLDGSNSKQVFQQDGGGGFSPTWSPDGKWIVFGYGTFFAARENKPAQLMMIRADGTDKRELTSGPVNSGFPSWSPDGKHIVYRVWTKEARSLQILDLDNGKSTQLTSGNDNFPMWSPRGDRICFTRDTGGTKSFDIFTIRPDGTDLKQLTDAPGNDAHCAWSPDAKQIVFSSSRLGFRDETPLYDGSPQPYAELFVMDQDGSNPRPITDDKWEEGTPAWAPAESAVHEAYVTVPGARIFYLDTGGSGKPVVLLHAATGSSRVWDYQLPAFSAAGYRIIAFDRRGWGRTEINSGEAQSGASADDLLALIDHLHLDRVHLVGTAAGAFVALDFALSYPQHVRSLVFANSIGGVEDADFLELGRRIRPPQFDTLPPEFRELGPSYRAGNPSGTERWVELEKISRPEGPRAAPQPLRNHITFALLETLKTPTLLITGGADLYAPPPVLQLFAARIKGSEVSIVPEAGHSTYWEQPEVFNRTVLNFLAKH
jgi:Tol biopolymer transport system component